MQALTVVSGARKIEIDGMHPGFRRRSYLECLRQQDAGINSPADEDGNATSGRGRPQYGSRDASLQFFREAADVAPTLRDDAETYLLACSDPVDTDSQSASGGNTLDAQVKGIRRVQRSAPDDVRAKFVGAGGRSAQNVSQGTDPGARQ